jgi:hypothetical protein
MDTTFEIKRSTYRDMDTTFEIKRSTYRDMDTTFEIKRSTYRDMDTISVEYYEYHLFKSFLFFVMVLLMSRQNLNARC